jgi:hypothetical protein
LVFGANEIIYLNQATPAFGMAVNAFNAPYTRFPLSMCTGHQGIFFQTSFRTTDQWIVGAIG